MGNESDETPRTASLRKKIEKCELKSPAAHDDRDIELPRRPLADHSNTYFSPIKCSPSYSKPGSPNVTGSSLELSLNLDQTLGTTFEDEGDCSENDKLENLCTYEIKAKVGLFDRPKRKISPSKLSPAKRKRSRLSEENIEPDAKENILQSTSKRLRQKCWSDGRPNALRTRIPTPIFANENLRTLQRPHSCITITDEPAPSKYLTVSEVADLIDGEPILKMGENSIKFSRVCIVDARYAYEFDGGHIKGALNIPKEDDVSWQTKLKEEFFNGNQLNENSVKTVVVMHCEFSSKRGPALFHWFRKYDRELNKYPDLFYPHLYIMKNGYSRFYNTFAKEAKRDVFGPVRSYRHENDGDFDNKNKSIRRRKRNAKRTRIGTRSYDRHLRSKDEGTPTKKKF